MRFGFIVAAFLLVLTLPARADLDEAQAAFDRGDYAIAMRELRPLAERGDAAAQSNLGFLYKNGLGVGKDESEALRWFRKAAEQEHAEAQYNLGIMYFEGLGIPKVEAEAAKWFRKAGDQGFAPAQYHLV